MVGPTLDTVSERMSRKLKAFDSHAYSTAPTTCLNENRKVKIENRKVKIENRKVKIENRKV